MKRAMKELQDSGILDKASGKGDKAPNFTVENSTGRSINLKETLSKGPVVLGFYRGRW
jgi:peroxiredoxin